MPVSSPILGALLLAKFVSSSVAAGDSFGGGRMVIVRAATAAAGGGAGARDSRETTAISMTWLWRLEDKVAPEFPSAAGGGGLLHGDGIDYSAFCPRCTQCVRDCAAKGRGDSYTQKKGEPQRPCLYISQCRPS